MKVRSALPPNLGRVRLPAWAGCLAVLLALLACVEGLTELLRSIDVSTTTWVMAHRQDWLTSVAVDVTRSGTSALLYPLVAAAGAVVWLRTRRWVPGLTALAVVVSGVLSRLVLSRVVGDARPPGADRLVTVHGFSFPSGHATTSALVAGAVALLLAPVLSARPARMAVVCLVGAWAVLVALSRIYLGVHWVTDIVGSWLLAGTWLACLALVLEGLHRRSDRTAPAPSSTSVRRVG